MDTAAETALRLHIIDWVRERAEANAGFLHRQELLSFRVDGRDLPIIDFSRGIRNPREFSSTLSIVSAADGPYDDTESDDGHPDEQGWVIQIHSSSCYHYWVWWPWMHLHSQSP